MRLRHLKEQGERSNYLENAMEAGGCGNNLNQSALSSQWQGSMRRLLLLPFFVLSPIGRAFRVIVPSVHFSLPEWLQPEDS